MHIKFYPLSGGFMLLALASCLACGPGEVTTTGVPGSDSDFSTTTSDPGSESSTTTAGPTGSDSDGTGTDGTITTEATTTDPSSETDSDTDTETGGIDCLEPEDVDVEFMLEPEVDEVDLDCVVAAVEELDGAFTVELTCGQESYTLWFASSFLDSPELTPALEVRLVYASSPGELGPNRWLAIQREHLEGQYLSILGGVSAATLNPPGTTFEAFFVDPKVTVVDSICDPVDLRCGPVERVGLHFADESRGGEATVFDQGAGCFSYSFVGKTQVVVAEAVTQVENSCEQGSATWFEVGWFNVYYGP